MRFKMAAALAVVMLLARQALAENDSQKVMDVGGVQLSLGMPRDQAMKALQPYTLRQDCKDDYWNVYEDPDTTQWLGAVLFNHNRLELIVKSWAAADDQGVNGQLRKLLTENGRTCSFTLAQTPRGNSSLKLTSFICKKRRITMQVNTDEPAGVLPCNVETLGDPGDRLKRAEFWKSCRKGPR